MSEFSKWLSIEFLGNPHWCKYLDYEEYLKTIEEINFEILKNFEAEGIEFAFPTQTLYVKSDDPANGAPKKVDAKKS